MKKITLVSAALVALGAGNTAMAATGLPGFYINGGLGYGAWSADTTTVNSTTGVCTLCVVQTQGGKGEQVKVGIGYDHQFTNNLIAGVLADYDFSSIKGTIQDQGPFFAGRIKQQSAWAAGARIGWLFTPDTLSYINLGYSEARFSGTTMVTTFLGTPTTFATPSFNKGGWFVGLGMETMLTTRWFLRGEYRYAGYGSTTITDTFGAVKAANITFKPAVQTGTIQVVYKF